MLPDIIFTSSPDVLVAAGKHMPDAAELLKIRTYIAADPDELFKITGGKKFREHFGELNGDRLTRPPKGFDADHPAIEFLKLRSFTVTREFTEKEALSPDYPKLITGAFKTAFPLVAFLRKALRQ